MPGNKSLRVGIVGGGFMATVHTRAAHAAGAEVVALASSSRSRAEKSASTLRIPNALGFEELCAAGLDVVHICTPNATHAEYAQDLLRAGVHVVCEKPLATSVADADALVALAAETRRIAAVPFVYRYHPMVQEFRARLRAGEAGRPLVVQGSYLQDWLLDASAGNWRVDATDGGSSRAFGDVGSHLVDLLEFVTEERVAELNAATSIAYRERGGVTVATEDSAALIVKFASGLLGTLLISQTAAGHDNDLRLEVMGTKASLAFAQEQPDVLQLARPGERVRLSRTPQYLHEDAQDLSLVPAGHPMGYQDAFNAFARDVYAAVEGQERERMPVFADGARMVRVTEAVLESARRGEWVTIETRNV